MLTKTQILDALEAWAKDPAPFACPSDYFQKAGLPPELAKSAQEAYYGAGKEGTIFRRAHLGGNIEGIWRSEIDAIRAAIGEPTPASEPDPPAEEDAPCPAAGKPPIQTWEYDDTPPAYQAAIEDPSDLDWVVFVPDAYGEAPWLGFLRDNELTTIVPVEGGKLHLFYHA